MVFSFFTKQNKKTSGRKILEKAFFRKNNISPLEALVGVNSEGKPVIYNLATAPHLLTSGCTGSGVQKSINSMYLSLMEHNSPDDLKLIVIDLIATEFISYNKTPFMYTDVITDLQKALKAFNFLIEEMRVREKLLEELGVRNLETYNSRVSVEKKRPHLLLYVDEFADLMYEYGDEIEDSMQRLGQKARSLGITIHFNTHVPNANIIKGKVRANLPSQIAYKLDTPLQSDLVLGEIGAEKLLGKGDSYVKWSTNPNLVRVQGVYLSDEETTSFINSIVNKYPDEKYYNRVDL